LFTKKEEHTYIRWIAFPWHQGGGNAAQGFDWIKAKVRPGLFDKGEGRVRAGASPVRKGVQLAYPLGIPWDRTGEG